ncbi:helix-turn-helix domain-containing protein [Streptomyces sp. STCH 565 A]|uniref:helix-turn-helix domain-containing protein n=1 Tax=Streptomyces sp. STCH 565 A TaxID=2950532 RepID=UPI002074D688|nr:helix-turn-helix transcriptional regulator [Streptomyces sp. STCH 565 A]MCM8552666.1 helix-turn-helix transcriptional regulator [Streptomyces sp. STCH 565 A]
MPLRTNGPEIRRRRELAGMNQTEFAKATGYAPAYVSQIENGHVNAGPRFQRKAAAALACDVADITAGVLPWGTVGPTYAKASAA